MGKPSQAQQAIERRIEKLSKRKEQIQKELVITSTIIAELQNLIQDDTGSKEQQ